MSPGGMALAKIYSSEFGDTSGWILVNDFTIHEPRQLKDRPFMVTRVPKRIHVKMFGVRAVEGVEWAGDQWTGELTVDDAGDLVRKRSDEKREEGFTRKRWISGSGTFEDKITIFTIPDGAVAKYQTFSNVQIRPASHGTVGGKYKATSSDGIYFSGMSSKTVPERGLMEGEPGSLWLDDQDYGRKKEVETLNAELYLDQEQFDELFEAIRDGVQSIESVHVGVVAELFEGEVQASLSEPWMDHEYGILKKGDWVQTRARVDSIHVSFGGRVPMLPVDPDDEAEDSNQDRQEAATVPTSPVHDAELKALVKRLHARGGWILAVLVALVLITLAK